MSTQKRVFIIHSWGGYQEVRPKADKFIAIFSDDDPNMSFSDSEIFANMLGAKIITEHNKKHFSGSTGTIELPIALESLLEIAGEK